MTEFAYKVVRNVFGTDKIFASVLTQGKARLLYAIGEQVFVPEWLAEKGLYPLLFDNLSGAIEFQMTLINIESSILKCSVEDRVELSDRCRPDLLSSGVVVKSNSTYYPEDTVSYKTVTPVEVIKKPKPREIDLWNYFEVERFVNLLSPFDKNKWWNYLISDQWPNLQNDTFNVFRWFGSLDPEIDRIGNAFCKYLDSKEVHFWVSW